MANAITPSGLTVDSQADITNKLVTGMQTIYGADINLESDTPDGQKLGIFTQVAVDILELLVQINANFDPDQAFGVMLDQRVAYNGIARQAGTYTVTPILIVADGALNLYGLDQIDQPVYTVADNTGNQWQLIQSQSISAAGNYSYLFQSATPGAVLTIPNTITVPVTIVLGVSSINNPTTYSTLGINEETDAELKLRRARSVSLSSIGYSPALEAALENINGVTSAKVYENRTNATNADGVPAHSIWVIVQGGLPADIAQAIYMKRGAGADMFGIQEYTIMQPDGSPFVINWDYVTPQNLYIRFTVSSLDGVNPPNTALIASRLVTMFTPGVNEQVNINDLATIVQSIDPNSLVTNAGFSLTSGGTYTPKLSPSAKNRQFNVSSGNITITVGS